MKNLTALPIGTPLMWDTMQHLYGQKPKRIYYPCIVSDQDKRRRPNLGAKIKTGTNNAQWMGDENENLRLPTVEELQKFESNFKELQQVTPIK